MVLNVSKLCGQFSSEFLSTVGTDNAIASLYRFVNRFRFCAPIKISLEQSSVQFITGGRQPTFNIAMLPGKCFLVYQCFENQFKLLQGIGKVPSLL